MNDEQNQFIKTKVWERVPYTPYINVSQIKWALRNKMNNQDVISRNKATKGFNQEEELDSEETYFPVTRL